MSECPIESTVELVGDRWSLLLVGALLAGPRRTTELVADLAPISTRTLAERLKRLEGAGLVTRRSFPESPPRVEYQLTERGFALRGVLEALRRAADAWELPACGDTRCPQCGVPPSLVGDDTEPAENRRSHRGPDAFDVTLL